MIASTILVLGILIFVHELGHFLVAKRMGVTVLRFSLGFGPRLASIERGGTEYCLSAIPLGGYVKMLGEDPEEGEEQKLKPDSFAAQPVGKRMGIVAAGPLSNLILAIILFTLLFAFYGIPYRVPEVGKVLENSPAAHAGIQAGDRVVTINDVKVKDWEELSETIQKLGHQELTIQLQRGEETLAVRVKPEVRETRNIFGESIEKPVIGIEDARKIEIEKVNPLLAAYHSVAHTLYLTKMFMLTVVKLVQRVLPMNTLGGPILIAQMAGEQAQAGLLNLVNFIALISVNLAILNLLPIPILDGGHLFFFLIEAVRGRPIAVKKIEIAQRVGLILLLLLMVVVFYNDIARLLPGANKGLLP